MKKNIKHLKNKLLNNRIEEVLGQKSPSTFLFLGTLFEIVSVRPFVRDIIRNCVFKTFIYHTVVLRLRK